MNTYIETQIKEPKITSLQIFLKMGITSTFISDIHYIKITIQPIQSPPIYQKSVTKKQ